jgi:hypothetical protein
MKIAKAAIGVVFTVMSVTGVAVSGAPAANESGTRQAGGAAYPQGHFAALNALPDWGGIWTLNFAMPKPGTQPSVPALKGQYLESYHAWQKQVEATHGEVPHEGSYCRPPGMPIIMMAPQYPIEFLFTPGRVTVHHEAWMQWRNIFTDERGHASDLDPTFNGDSIGTWQGNTLVIDTVGVKDSLEVWMGMKHSARLRMVERIHLASGDPDTLVDDMTVYDPVAFEKPWTTQLTYKRMRDGELLEFECAENDRNPVDATGHTGFK